jgi:hypothetical protein
MAIKIGGITVINDSRGLENITDGLSPEVKTPQITFPEDGATGFSAIDAPNIKVIAPYYSLYDFAKKGTEIQIDNNSDFSSPLINTFVGGTDTTFLFDSGTYSFATSTTYYVRVRHQDTNDVYSEWSSTVSFTTPSTFSFITTPSITSPTTGAIDIGEFPSFTSSAFGVTPSGVDTHVSSDWQIATDSNFTNIVDSSIGDTSNRTSYTATTGLTISTTYYVRVRYNGNTLTSEYSNAISFTTASQFAVYWMAYNTDVEKYGESYADGGGVIVDNAGNRSFIGMGQRGNSFEVHRMGTAGTDEGRIEYQSVITGSSTYAMGAVQVSSTEVCAAMHYNGNDRGYFGFFDISNGGLSHNSTWQVHATSYGTMRGVNAICSAGNGTSIYGVSPITSSYNGYYIWKLKNDGTIEAQAKADGASYIFPRDIMVLSNGQVVVSGVYRDGSNVNYFMYQRWDAGLTTIYDHKYITTGYQGYSNGNNNCAIELANGNVLFTDWQFTLEMDILDGVASQSSVVRSLSIPRSDRVWEKDNGNILITTSQSQQRVYEYEPSGSGYNWVRGVELDYTVGSDEWSGSDYDAGENSIYAHGRAYSGSSYNGHIHKIPDDLTKLPLETGFPNDTRWNWSAAAEPSSSGVSSNVGPLGTTVGLSIYTNAGVTSYAQSPTIGSFSQNTTFYDYE